MGKGIKGYLLIDRNTQSGVSIDPRGPLLFEVGYHHIIKNHIIRVVFQDQAMYMRTLFSRGGGHLYSKVDIMLE